jgi:ElaB/YqjD/DUF883 family membrane-anchored ribosome-binding protein
MISTDTLKNGRHAGLDGAGFDTRNAAAMVADELRTLVSELQDMVQGIASDADPALVQMRRRIEAAMAQAKRTVMDGQHRIERQARGAIDRSDQYVRNNPWRTARMAAIVGVVVGVVIARLRR